MMFGQKLPHAKLRRAILLLSVAFAVSLASLAALWLTRPLPSGILLAPGAQPTSDGTPMIVADGYTTGGPFSLTDQQGRAVTHTDFAGRYMLIFFGYSFCPDVCPLELGGIAHALQTLETQAPDKAARLVPVFVTVDPRRDTPEILKDYVAQFHPRMAGLTGTQDQIAQITQAYRVFVHFGEDNGDGYYLVDHSAFTYLMGPEGEFVAMFQPNFDPQGLARSLDRLIDESGG